MKLLIASLIGFGLLATTLPATAQNDDRLRKDHTYSTHNYKHPNKAAVAQRLDAKEGVLVETPSRLARQDNRPVSYKNQLPGRPAVGGVSVLHTTNEALTNRNYKMPKPLVRPERTNTTARKRNQKQADTTATATGD